MHHEPAFLHTGGDAGLRDYTENGAIGPGWYYWGSNARPIGPYPDEKEANREAELAAQFSRNVRLVALERLPKWQLVDLWTIAVREAGVSVTTSTPAKAWSKAELAAEIDDYRQRVKS